MPDPPSPDAQRLPTAEWSRFWGLRFRARERLARSLVIVPTLYIAAALALAEVVPLIDGRRDILGLALDADSARTILSAIATGMIAFTGLVVSIAILVVQFGASQYTPRLVNRFRRDPQVKHSLGIFVAPTIFALVSLRKIGQSDATVVPSLTMTVNMLLLVAAVVAFFLLVAGLLDLLRPRRIVGQIVREAGEGIRETYPAELRAVPNAVHVGDLPVSETVRHPGPPGVLSALDRGRLVRAARQADGVVEVAVGVGAYVPTGEVLLLVRGATGPVDERELRRGALLADERTIAQDPAFAIRAIVDIALRALSPAVNDPTTAVQALDGIDSLLSELGSRDLLSRAAVTDSHGTLRLVYPTPSWADLLDLSLTEIRHYGASSPQIPRRLRALLEGLLATTPEARHADLGEQLGRLDAAVREAYPDPDQRAFAARPDILGIGGGRRG